MKILLTGASGFIGSNVLRNFVAGGHTVYAQYRRRPGNTVADQVHWQQADLSAWFDANATAAATQLCASAFQTLKHREPHAMQALLANLRALLPIPEAARTLVGTSEIIVHMAALASDWGRPQVFIASNVLPVYALLEAAWFAGVRRFVFVSSIAVHGFGNHTDSTESGPYAPVLNLYQLSKRLAESLALAYAQEGMDISIVRPGNVYGPGDHTTFYPLFDAMTAGNMGTIDNGSRLTCPIYIDDLVSGISGIIARPAGSNRQMDDVSAYAYNFTGPDRITWRELCDHATRELGCKPVSLNAPSWLLYPLSALMEVVWALGRSKTPPPLTRYRVGQLAGNYHFNTRRAQTEIGWQAAVGFAEGIKHTVNAYRKDRHGR